jgi:hypothetical protein
MLRLRGQHQSDGLTANVAHRSEYGFGGKVNEKTGEMSYGFASNLRDALPNASFIWNAPQKLIHEL